MVMFLILAEKPILTQPNQLHIWRQILRHVQTLMRFPQRTNLWPRLSILFVHSWALHDKALRIPYHMLSVSLEVTRCRRPPKLATFPPLHLPLLSPNHAFTNNLLRSFAGLPRKHSLLRRPVFNFKRAKDDYLPWRRQAETSSYFSLTKSVLDFIISYNPHNVVRDAAKDYIWLNRASRTHRWLR